MVQMKRNMLSVALVAAIGMTATVASAQSAPANDATTKQDAKKADEKNVLDSVVVTGIRRGIEGAISTKKNSTSIVEAVSAEDIGKLPDVSIAESIARLPGLSAQRVAGRAQVISVRGLSPDFSTTLLNGREMVSTGDNRSVEFDQYPSELMAGVTVYKTPDAGLIGQGLSGTIDMHTVRPLDFSKSVTAVGVRGQRNSLGSAANQSANGNRFNASYIGQFFDRKFGIALGYAHSENPLQEEQVGLYEPWEPIGPTWRPGVPSGAGCPASGSNCTYYSEGIKALRGTGFEKRDAVMATLEFRPSSVWTSTLDMFYTKSHSKYTANQFEVNLGDYNGGYGHINVTNPQINGNGTFEGGTAANLYPLVRGMYDKRDDKIKAFGWRNDFNLGNAKLFTDLSYSHADRKELSLENNTQLYPAPQLDTLNLAYTSNGFPQLNPGLNYSDPSKLYLQNTIYGSGYGKVPEVHDTLKSARVGASFGLSGALGKWFSDIEVGLNYADREKNKKQPEASINLGPQGVTSIAPDLQYGLVNLGFAGIGNIPAWNVPGAVARYMTFDPQINQSYLYAKTWSLSEKITTAYLKANLDTQLGSDVSLRGNIGVQVQHVDQSSSANSVLNNNTILPVTLGAKYNEVLPSMNLAFMFPHDQALRFALAKQTARPRIDDMNASISFGVDNATGKTGGGGGNPQLRPWRANALDISYEKYFGTKAYVSAAFYYKQLTSYIFNQTSDGYDWSNYVASYPAQTPPAGSTYPPIQSHGTFTAPQNGKGGKMQGVELTASLPFEMFTPVLKGFGVVASASFNDSSIKIPPPDGSQTSVGNNPIALPGLSKRVYNLTAYYERNGFEARISQRRRSDFIGEIGNFNGNRTLRYVVGENITDAQVSYNFSDSSSLKGLSVLLQATNLTDSPYKTYAQTKDRPLEYIKWGRTVLLGASYKF
ncbi:TonB-dependent receptor [Solilutibacter silvestris]|uniref:TonB-Xanth-Caul: TonB-dependent receptor n=1 Tax=Solilutibacter silvestris TaxID=1645665 RepID=A0A2K1PZ41_9GAMM|nr:TonB-dependent receptor [Lysobacter silvestris]PNS08056.1 TonB-Xanth-Caul: TonB-dependent receptor [Lysobacter silvestris]